MKPVPLGSFRDHVTDRHKEQDKGFEAEYQVCRSLPMEMMSMFSVHVCVYMCACMYGYALCVCVCVLLVYMCVDLRF